MGVWRNFPWRYAGRKTAIACHLSRRTPGHVIDDEHQLVGRERTRSDPAHRALSVGDHRGGKLRQAKASGEHAARVVHDRKRELVARHHAFGACRIVVFRQSDEGGVRSPLVSLLRRGERCDAGNTMFGEELEHHDTPL